MKLAGLFSVLLLILSISSSTQSQWYVQNSGVNKLLFDVHFVDENNGWIAGNTGLILNTTDGGVSWSEQITPPNNQYYSIFFTDTQNGWAGGFAGKLIRTTDGGTTWMDGTAGTNRLRYDLYFINPDSGWVVGGDHGGYPSFIPNREILFTSDGGNSWITQYGQSHKPPLNAINIIDRNNGFAVGESGAVMQTTNGGNTWLETSTLTSYHLRDVTFVNQNTGWILGYYLGLPHTSAVFKTTDGGVTWSEQTFGVDESFSSITFLDELNGWIVGGQTALGNSYILHTSDGGENWEYQSSPVNDFLFKVFFHSNNTGWAVGNNGAVIATDNSVPVELTSFTATVNTHKITLNWQTASETNNSGFEIERKSDASDWLQVGFVPGYGTSTEPRSYSFNDQLQSGGNYSYRLKQIDFDGSYEYSNEVNVSVSIPVEFRLAQNYPNPFNPSTTIEFSIPNNALVTLKVYNTIGEEVAVLVNEELLAGSHSVRFNASGFASGIYIVKMTAGNFSDVKKMNLLK